MNETVEERVAPPIAVQTRQEAEPTARPAVAFNNAGIAVRIFATVGGLVLFVLALQLLKSAAVAVIPILNALAIHGAKDMLGFGWLAAYGALSGSPIASLSLTLYSAGAINNIETFAMINGSRLGAGFVVLFIGFIYYLRRHNRANSLFVGILLMLTTASIYLPAMGIGYLGLTNGWFSFVHLDTPAPLVSIIDLIYKPFINFLRPVFPGGLLVLFGMIILLLSFRVFDKALPEVNPDSRSFRRISSFLEKPLGMFALGSGITLLTLSVAVSVSILIPLHVNGYVRRRDLIPYLMGANITTFGDTLVASILLQAPGAPIIVLAEMLSVALVSLIVIFFFYNTYRSILLGLTERILARSFSLYAFIGIIMVVPIALILL